VGTELGADEAWRRSDKQVEVADGGGEEWCCHTVLGLFGSIERESGLCQARGLNDSAGQQDLLISVEG
jgi:hypothetical protein